MQFNDNANNEDLVSDANFWGQSDDTSFSIEDKVRSANDGLDWVLTLILQADSRWEFDGTNQSDRPIGTTPLVANQQPYGIATTHLRITRVEAKDTAGNYQRLKPMSANDISAQALSEFQKSAATPRFYDKEGNQIILYPAPSYADATGLKVYFQRAMVKFTTTSTTAVPGFASTFHRLISLYMARDHCIAEGKDSRLERIEREIAKRETALQTFYISRARDDKPRLRLRKEHYGDRLLGNDFLSGDERESVNFQ